MNLIQLISCNKPEWFKGYWVFASQYADYTVAERSRIPYEWHNYFMAKSRENIEDNKKILMDNPDLSILQSFVNEKYRLCELHHMILAYLMYVGKKDLVDWCFLFSLSSLNTQLLIPKKISDIIEELARLQRYPSGPIDFKYPFYQENGIRSGEMIENALIRFYIYSLHEQESKFTDGLSRVNPWACDFDIDYNDANIIHYTIHLLDLLRERLYPNQNYFESIGISGNNIERINDSLINIQEKLNNKLKELAENVEINSDDKKRANELLKIAVENGKILDGINTIDPIETTENPLTQFVPEREVGITMSKGDYIWNPNTIFETLMPSIISQMNYIAQTDYLRIFLLNSDRKRFYVNYDEIAEALQKLGVLDNRCLYAIIPVGVVPPPAVIKDCEPSLMRGNRSEIIIMARKHLPAASIKDYTNLESSIESNDNNIFFGGKIKISYTYNEKIDYVRLVIVNSLIDGRASQLNWIDRINTYLCVE